jgi:hypothetical protein
VAAVDVVTTENVALLRQRTGLKFGYPLTFKREGINDGTTVRPHERTLSSLLVPTASAMPKWYLTRREQSRSKLRERYEY